MDYTDDPHFKAWRKDVEENLIPKLEDSACTVSIMPQDVRGKPDVKFAVELGMSILMGKPIVVVVSPGSHVPAKLAQIADEIVEVDWDSPGATVNVQAAIAAALDRMGLRD